MCGGGDVNYPEPSGEERALQQSQTDALNLQTALLLEQIRQQQLLAPIIYRQAGLEPTYDEAGDITGFTEIVDPNTALQDQIETELLNRQIQALHGELPVDPTLAGTLDTEERALREQMQRQVGPGWETSKPGIEALGSFRKRKAELISAANRGEISTAAQIEQSREEQNRINEANTMLRYSSGATYPYSSQGLLTPLVQGYNQPLDRMRSERSSRYGADAYMAGQEGAAWGGLLRGLMNLGGQLGAAYMYNY